MLDRCGRALSNAYMSLCWQTASRGGFDPQRIIPVLTNHAEPTNSFSLTGIPNARIA